MLQSGNYTTITTGIVPGIRQVCRLCVFSFSIYTGNSVATSHICVITYCVQFCESGLHANTAPNVVENPLIES